MGMSKSFFKVLRDNVLFLFLFLGAVLGIFLGIFLNDEVQQSSESRKLAMLIGFPGELFLRMLMFVVLPFISSSIITSLTKIDKNAVRQLGKRAVIYYLVTTLIATSLSVVLGALIIKPQTHEYRIDQTANTRPIYAILDMIRNMVPDNIIEASISSTRTKLEKRVTNFTFVNKSAVHLKSSPGNLSSLLKKEEINPWSISADSIQIIKEGNVIYEYVGQEKYNSANLLGVLVLSIVFGIVLNGLGDNGKAIADFFSCLFQLFMKIVEIIMWFSPIGITSIIAGKLAAMNDIGGTMENIGLYVTAVLITSVIFAVVVTGIYVILLRRNPFKLMRSIAKALLTAFGVGSSAACLPVTLTCLKENKVVDDRLAQFMLPIGTVLNAPGTAITIAVGTMFVVQTFHPYLRTVSSCILISVSSTIATLAAPPIPGSVLIAVQGIVLQVIGIPTADVWLIFAVEWLTDRISTPVNIWANSLALVIFEHYSRDELQSLDDCTEALEEVSVVSAKGAPDSTHTNAVVIDIADEVVQEDEEKKT
ncbi:excitatory amino acid transporter 1-like [Dendronephthya gigantea]|uniref:excitatory amino acid transporter 1-like n=1 Tax=Dendronephthya gigantea TaxID=151771 RepID=UPI00106B0197|nr:excitatory amino acid transporter 1-like [Dendronephthya gigantea]